jgi:beta-phosphoglucomutase-like phosphatase (HAD superfamily)
VIEVPAPREGSIAVGQSVGDTITAVGEWHRYRLTATAGQVLYLDAEGACVDGLWWRLLDQDGVLTTFSAACDDIGRRVLDEAGDWTIEVYSDELATGAYSFRVIGVPAAREAPITFGQSVTDATTAIGEWHRYRLTAIAGQIVYLDAQGECVDRLWWRLLDQDGVLTTFSSVCTDMGRRVLDEAGDWIIEVYSDELATGTYSFRVIGVPAARESPITLGQSVSDATSAIGEWHRYRLSAQAGDKVVIDAQGECVDQLNWRLLDPDGSLETFANSCTDSTSITLDRPGEWVIEIYSDTMATGSYAFTVNSAQ